MNQFILLDGGFAPGRMFAEIFKESGQSPMANDTEPDFYSNPKGLLENREYNYLMVNAIAKRVRGLQTGKTPTVLRTGDVLETAKQEFLADQLLIVPDATVQEVLEATRLEEERALATSRLLLDLEADSE